MNTIGNYGINAYNSYNPQSLASERIQPQQTNLQKASEVRLDLSKEGQVMQSTQKMSEANSQKPEAMEKVMPVNNYQNPAYPNPSNVIESMGAGQQIDIRL